MPNTKRIGVYAGTFDPITNGHLDIIRRSGVLVDRLVVAVAQDTAKDPVFSLEKRVELVREALQDNPTARDMEIHVIAFTGLLVNFAHEQGAHLLIRGLRAVSDYEYEFQMACMNSKLAPELETVFLTASESTHFIASRFVKQISRLGGDISALVPANVEQALKDYYNS